MENVFIKTGEFDILNKLFKNKDLISIDELVGCLEEQYFLIEKLEEDIEDLNRDIEENYKPIDKYDELGISESDFY